MSCELVQLVLLGGVNVGPQRDVRRPLVFLAGRPRERGAAVPLGQMSVCELWYLSEVLEICAHTNYS